MTKTRPKAYRYYRATTYVTYIVATSFIISLPFISVVRSLIAHADVPPLPRESLVTAEAHSPLSEKDAFSCLVAMEKLHLDLRALFLQFEELTTQHGRESLLIWGEKLRAWEANRVSIAQECRLNDPSGGPFAELLSPISNALANVAKAYNNQATRLTYESASDFDELIQSFEKARKRLGGTKTGSNK